MYPLIGGRRLSAPWIVETSAVSAGPCEKGVVFSGGYGRGGLPGLNFSGKAL